MIIPMAEQNFLKDSMLMLKKNLTKLGSKINCQFKNHMIS